MNNLSPLYKKLSYQVLKTTLYFSLFTTLAICYRIYAVGWNNVYSFYFIVIGLFTFLYFQKAKKLSKFNLHVIAITTLFAGFWGMFFLGLSGGIFYSVTAIILATILWGTRQGTIYAIGFASAYTVAAILYSTGIWSISIDLEQYNNNFNTWLSNGIALAWLITIAILSAGYFKQLLNSSLNDLLLRQKESFTLNARLSQQLDFLPVAVLLLNEERKPIYINQSFTVLFGFELAVLPRNGLPLSLFGEQKHADEWKKTIETCFASSEENLTFNCTIKTPAGIKKHLTVYFKHIESEVEICFVDNTPRIHASEKFNELEQRFKNLLDNSIDGIAVIDQNDRIIIANNKLVQLSGQSKDLLLQIPVSKLFGDDFDTAAINETENNQLHESTIQGIGDEKIPVEVGASEFEAEGSQFKILFIRDIKDRKEARKKIQESEKRYRTLFENMPIGYAVHEIITEHGKPKDYIFLEMNSAFEKSTGLKKTSIIGHTALEVLPQLDQELINAYGEVAMGGLPLQYEYYAKDLDRYFDISVFSPKEGQFATCFSDITTSKLADTKIRMSEERFNLALTGANAGLWDWDIINDKLYFSPTWKNMLGYTDGEINNKLDSWKALLHPLDRINAIKGVENFIASEASLYEMEFRMIHKDGTPRHILSRGNLHRDKNGTPIRFTGTHVDISEKKRIEEELQHHKNELEQIIEKRTQELEDAVAKLKTSNQTLAEQKQMLTKTLGNLHQTQNHLIQSEKMASLGILIAGIAHEINNPVNFISASLDGLNSLTRDLSTLMKQYDSLTAENIDSTLSTIKAYKNQTDFDFKLKHFEEAIKNIKSGTERITKIVSSLRTVSRTSSNEIVRVAVTDCIETSVSLLTHEIKHGITIEKHYGDAPEIWSDPNKLSQVFMNILMNAIQAMNGEGKISITLKTAHGSRSAIVIIKDEGPGIAPEVQEHIFEPFFSTKSVGQGTGLGLYICYEIIKELGGDIAIDTKLGEGTTFYISLPFEIQAEHV